MNQNEIRAMRRKERRFTPLRNSFITPDGPRDKGNKSKPIVRIEKSHAGQSTSQAPITKKKQGKKTQGPLIPVVDPSASASTLITQRANLLAQSHRTTLFPKWQTQLGNNNMFLQRKHLTQSRKQTTLLEMQSLWHKTERQK